MTTIFTEDFDGFMGAGFAPVPGAGQLDSDFWRVTGLSDGPGIFGGTHTSGDFARGSDADGNVTTGGVYAFTIGSNTVLGVQPGGSDFTPGAFTLRLSNTTGSEITTLDISYDIFFNNDQARGNSLDFAWSTDDVTYTSVSALDFTSPEAADGSGFQSVNRMTTLTGLSIAPGADLYLQWQGDDVSGGGSRDEFGIDNVSVGLAREVIARTDFDGNDVNLVSGFDPATDNLDGGPGDFFGVGSITGWPQTAGVPFSLADDSVANVSGGGVNASDTEGVFGQNADADNDFFALSDSDEFSAGQTASWTFDISGASDLALTIDMGGIADGNSFGGYDSQTVTFTYSIDGGAAQTAFSLASTTTTGGFAYRAMDVGTVTADAGVLAVTGDAPVTKLRAEDGSAAGDTFLDKTPASGAGAGELDTFRTDITGTGSTLTLTMTADFAFEAMAFDNIVLTGIPGAASPMLVINEVDADTAGTDTLEFVELFDGGIGNTALDGFVVVLFNGSSDTSYAAFDLDGFSTDADGYFVLGNAGVANVGLTFADNTLQNGADAVALYQGDATDFPDGTAVTATNLADAVVYDTDDGDDTGLIGVLTPGEAQANENANSNKDNEANARVPNGTGAFVAQAPTPGAENVVAPSVQEVRIHEVQGTGATSPLDGQSVRVQGIVTGVYPGLEGFFLQEEDAEADADPLTSEGIFVFLDDVPTVSEGDLVTVTGAVDEFFGMTQIDNDNGDLAVTVDSGGNALPTAVAIADRTAFGSVTDAASFEALEGMIVTFGETLVVSEYFELARYGQVILYPDARPYQFTQTDAPDVAGFAAHLAELEAERVILDDGDNIQNSPIVADPDTPVFHPAPGGFSTGTQGTDFFRGGDTVSDLTGILHWSWAGQSGTDAWRVRPVETTPAEFTPVNTRPAEPEDVGGNVKVASFNVLNYFATIDATSGSSGPVGPSGTLDARGADSLEEFDRQTDKLVAAILGLDADVLGLVEIENDDDDASLAALVDALNAVAGAGTYAFVATGFIGQDAIKVGFVYKPGTVTPTGTTAVLDTPDFVDPNDTGLDRNRPALAQSFEVTDPANPDFGAVFTPVVNHFKSKGASNLNNTPSISPTDVDALDGQGFWNDTRTKAAQALADWLATDPTGTGDPDILILGDLNAYARETPITALEAAGYTDLARQFEGPEAYGYLFSGQLGTLDYALANAALLPQVTGATTWHINADEVPLFDYNDTVRDTGEASFEAKPDANPLFEPNAFRTSDHDPILVGLDLTVPPPPNGAPVAAGDAFGTDEDTALAGNVLGAGGGGQDSDPDGDPLTVTAVNGSGADVGAEIVLPSGARLTLRADGSFDYDPAGAFDALGEGETAADGFSYTVADGEGGSASASVTITVSGVNDAPVVVDDAAELFATQATATIFAAANDTDAEGDPLSIVALSTAGLLGTASIAGDGSRIIYTPGPAFAGLADGETAVETLGYTVSDGRGGTATGTVTLTVRGPGAGTAGTSNVAPVAQDDAFVAGTAGTATGSVFADNGSGPDSDPDGDPLSILLVNGAAAVGSPLTLPSGAELRLNADGSFTYAAAEGGPLVDRFTYVAGDGRGGADEALVTIRLAPPPPPVEEIPGTDGDDAFVFDDLDTPRRVEGGAGEDTATLPGALGDFTIEPIEGGFRFVPASGAPIEFLSVETFVLDDATLVVTDDPETIKLALVYDVSFDRLFDIPGITFWEGIRAGGLAIEDIADFFAASPEFEERFGADLDAGQFFDVLYGNSFQRDADDDGRLFWVGALERGEIDRGEAIHFFAASEELARLNENAIDDGIFLLA